MTSSPPAGIAGAKKISSWADLPDTMGSPDRKWIRNEFGELYWNFDAEAGGYFMVDTPNTKVFTGFVRGRSFEYHGLTLQPGKTRLDWTTISLVKATGAPGKKQTPNDMRKPPMRAHQYVASVLGAMTWALSATAADPALTLTHASKAAYALHVDSPANPAERTAARELSRYLRQVTGAEFQVLTMPQQAQGRPPHLYVEIAKREPTGIPAQHSFSLFDGINADC